MFKLLLTYKPHTYTIVRILKRKSLQMLENQDFSSSLSLWPNNYPEVNVDLSCTDSVSQNITYTYEALTSRLYLKPGVQSNSTGIVGADWLGVTTQQPTQSQPAACIAPGNLSQLTNIMRGGPCLATLDTRWLCGNMSSIGGAQKLWLSYYSPCRIVWLNYFWTHVF